jgi:hypothetical protein
MQLKSMLVNRSFLLPGRRLLCNLLTDSLRRRSSKLTRDIGKLSHQIVTFVMLAVHNNSAISEINGIDLAFYAAFSDIIIRVFVPKGVTNYDWNGFLGYLCDYTHAIAINFLVFCLGLIEYPC